MTPIDKKMKDMDAAPASAGGGDKKPTNENQEMNDGNKRAGQSGPDHEMNMGTAEKEAAKSTAGPDAGSTSERDMSGPSSAAESRHPATEDTPEADNRREDHMLDPDKEIERLTEELARTRDSMLRKAAEFENLKRRTQKERLQLFEEARADAVSRFLPIREDLKRSVEASEGKDLEKGFVEGLKLVVSNFERVLKDYGVEAIEETGVPFDVDKHDAMLIQPAPDESTESNTVLQVLEPGYKIGDRVIRHAKVIVSQ